MGTRTLVRWLGITLLLDGVRSVIFGSGVAAWSFRQLAAPRSRGSVQPRLAVATRALGVAEALAGAWLVGGVSLRAAGLYRLIGHYYDYISLVWQKWLFRDAQATIESSLARWLPPNGRVLDLGCGTGANLDRIVSLRLPYGSYTGVDFSVTMLTEAARKFGNLSNVRFHQRDLASDPLPE